MLRLPHSDYFRDRHSEEELCQDFPADKIFIRGLHAMQAHFNNNGVYVEIPVVRVMNTAHYIAAYMFATTCSGDQLEYEVLAYDSFGCDKKLVPLTMIVLAAMLQRTEGFRAKQCRNLILDNRDPDFEEGVTLYDRFLRSAEEHFAEEDFLIDTHTLVQRNQQLEYENRQLITENKKLKIKYQNMEEKYQQINIGTQNNYTGCTINNYFGTSTSTIPTEQTASEDVPSEQKSSESFIFTKKAKKEGKEAVILQSLQNSVNGRKDKTRAFVQELHGWQDDGYVDAHYNARVMYDELDKLIPLSFGYEVFKKYYNNTI